MDDLAPIYNVQTPALAPVSGNNEYRYIHSHEEPDGIVSHTELVKERNAERGWDNKFSSGLAFISVRTGEDQKAKLEERLRELVHRDNQFYTIEDIEKFLDSTVYELNEAPRLLELSRQSVAAVTQANAADPDVLHYLADRVMGQFLGNSYTFDGEFMPGVGERVKAAVMFEKFPDACRELFGELGDPADIKEISIRTHQAPYIKAGFYDMLTAKDIPALLDVLDGDISQGYAAWVLEGEWSHFANAYDGISYTERVDNLDGTPKRTWPEAEVHRDWAIPRARRMGTVRDLLRQGFVNWPSPRPGAEEISPLRHPVLALRQNFHKPTDDESKQAVFNERVDSLRRNVMGLAPLFAAPKGLLTG